MDASIGETDVFAIGKTYASARHHSGVTRAATITGSFWHRLQHALKSRGVMVTQETVAEKFGVTQPTISGIWAKEGKGPEIALGAKIAATYHLSVHWLYTGQGNATVAPKDAVTERLMQLWFQLKDTSHAGKLVAFAETLVDAKNSDDGEGLGDTPASPPFRMRRSR